MDFMKSLPVSSPNVRAMIRSGMILKITPISNGVGILMPKDGMSQLLSLVSCSCFLYSSSSWVNAQYMQDKAAMVMPRTKNARCIALASLFASSPNDARYRTSKPCIRAFRKGMAAVRMRTTGELPLRLKFITSRARYRASASLLVSASTRLYTSILVAASEAVVPFSNASHKDVAAVLGLAILWSKDLPEAFFFNSASNALPLTSMFCENS